MASNYHPKGLLCAFAEEILRRTDPESPVVHVCKIENNSDVLIHETRETSALHSPNGDINDRMAPDVAEILAAREDETYAPVPRKYFDVSLFNLDFHTPARHRDASIADAGAGTLCGSYTYFCSLLPQWPLPSLLVLCTNAVKPGS